MNKSLKISSSLNNSVLAKKQSAQEFQASPQTLENPSEQRAKVIDWLIANDYPALPVAPKQDPFSYPKKNKKGEIEYQTDGTTPKLLFTGKNPSY